MDSDLALGAGQKESIKSTSELMDVEEGEMDDNGVA